MALGDAKDESIIAFLATIRQPKDLISILSWHLWWLGDRFPWAERQGNGPIEALLACGVRWEETNPERLTEVRRSLLKVGDYDLKAVLSRLRRPEICAPETYLELIRTPRMQERVHALGLVKKPVSEREQRRDQLTRLMKRYERATLYEQVWSQPVPDVARSYGISDVGLGKVCRKLRVPVPPWGYWARVRSGYRVRKPLLPKVNVGEIGNAGVRGLGTPENRGGRILVSAGGPVLWIKTRAAEPLCHRLLGGPCPGLGLTSRGRGPSNGGVTPEGVHVDDPPPWQPSTRSDSWCAAVSSRQIDTACAF